MHYLQSLLTLLIASNIPAERIWGILHSAGFEFAEGNVIRHEWGWISASALRSEMKQRGSLCAKLYKKFPPKIAILSTLSWESPTIPPDSKTQLIRLDDGTMECEALQTRGTIHGDLTIPGPKSVRSWPTDHGLDAYYERMYRALITERFLCFAVKGVDEYNIWRFHHELENIDEFVQKKAPMYARFVEINKGSTTV